MIRDFELAYDIAGEQAYLDQQEYEHMMQSAPEDFFPDEEDYPAEPEPDFDSCGFADDDGSCLDDGEWDDWDSGRYDDDPNPYDGTYFDDYDYGGEG